MSNPYDEALKIRDLAVKHNKFFEESIPLIASENIMSPLAMEMSFWIFGSRYAEDLPPHSYYQGNYYVYLVEHLTLALAKRFSTTKQAAPRPVSGTNANTAILFGRSNPGATTPAPPLSGGGHISAAKFGAVGLRGLNLFNYPFDVDDMNIDIDGSIKLIKKEKPKLCLFGKSVFLFPEPLKELNEAFKEVGTKVWYDAAHVLGLIAGGKFQDPLREGADVISGSTHKTFPGPQHGIILGNTDDDTWKKVQRGVFPGVLSNHHLNSMAALGVTIAEEIEYGAEYADKTIRNAQALGESLSSLGIKVLGEKHGFTKSHTIVADIRAQGGGRHVSEYLESCGVVLNKNLLPWDDNKKSQDPSGIRIGTQEVTRIGMGPSEMKEIADIISMAIVDNREVDQVKSRVLDLKSRFTETKYCFGKHKPYSYIELFNPGE